MAVWDRAPEILDVATGTVRTRSRLPIRRERSLYRPVLGYAAYRRRNRFPERDFPQSDAAERLTPMGLRRVGAVLRHHECRSATREGDSRDGKGHEAGGSVPSSTTFASKRVASSLVFTS